MKKDTNKFINHPRIDAPKIELTERKTKFIEIYKSYEQQEAGHQAERCLECGNPYCQWKCPVHNYIPNWLKLVQEGRIIEAAELSHQTNSFPEVCGRVCPQERLCEGSCTLDDGFGAVSIGNVEKYISDEAFKQGWSVSYPTFAANVKHVAIIGAGPAGLACADILARNGIKSSVFDRQAQIGGLMTYGIPAFKLEKDIIQRRRAQFEQAGVEFKLNMSLGQDIHLDELVTQYDAVFVATGTYQTVKEASISTNSNGVLEAIDYLTEVNTHVIDGGELSIAAQIQDKTVVVLGGGDTTMDCIRTSIRLGAKQVTGIYRRSEDDLPGSRREFKNSVEEGCIFEFNAQPVGLIFDGDKVCGVKCVRTRNSQNPDGRTSLEHIVGSEFKVDADVVITAFGFKPETLPWIDAHGVELDNHGRIKVQKNRQQTTNPKIFAGGDIVRGASLVVHAIADGMQAGLQIKAFLAQV